MSKNILLQSAKVVLLINIAFWLFLSLQYLLNDIEVNPVVFALILIEPLAYIAAFVTVVKRMKPFYIFFIFFTLINTVLSITDQMGFYDYLSLILSFLAFNGLLMIWPHMSIKKS